MKIKNLLIAALTVVTTVAFSTKAEAQINFTNNLPCYYLATFVSKSCPVAGFDCKSTNYYYDVPNNYSWNFGGPGIWDQSGSSVPASAINGICLKDYNTGQTFFIDLCRFGRTGTVTFISACFGGPLNVQWDLNVSPAILTIF